MGYQPDPKTLLSLDDALTHLSRPQLTLAIGTGQVRSGLMARGWDGIVLPDLSPKVTQWEGGHCCDIREGIKYYHYTERNTGTTRTVRKFSLTLFWYLWRAEAYTVLVQGSAPIGWLFPFEGLAFHDPNPELFPDPSFLVLLNEQPVITDTDLVFTEDDLLQWRPAAEPKDVIDNSVSNIHGNKEIYARKREPVLRAAIAVLAEKYDQCCNDQGKVESTKIRELIESSEFWPDTGQPPLATESIERLIRDCLKMTKDRKAKNTHR